MSRAEFYQSHLDQVSRSFAFCISQLKSPLKEWIGLSYLLLRVLDTIEDSAWPSAQAKQKAFETFDRSFSGSDQVSTLPALPEGTNPHEARLWEDFTKLIADFYQLPDNVQKNLKGTVLNMSRGMQYFSMKYPNKDLRLTSLKEVNQYCFFVAGVIGELLTQFVQQPQLLKKSIQFGLCLQKVNILKDQKEDEAQGRYLVPDKTELMKSFSQDARGAIEYLTQIPVSMREYRLFCAWSLFLGISSLSWMQGSLLQSLVSKLPRAMTQVLLSKIENMIDDNEKLLAHFQDVMAAFISSIPQTKNLTPQLISSDSGLWLQHIYQGELKPKDLAELGLV